MRLLFRKQIAWPQDHGAWVFILSPLLVGIFAGRTFSCATVSLVVAALGAFLLRQPMTAIVKSYSGRRPHADLPAGRFWTILYATITFLALVTLSALGQGHIAWLAIPGVPVFAWHLWLVSRRAERRQAGVEVIAAGALALAAPAAFWIGIGRYDPVGWWLWLLTWLQSAASIVHAYMRLGQRDQTEVPAVGERWKMGRRPLAWTSFNLALALGLGISGAQPRLLFAPYLVQWLETSWAVINPALRTRPAAIGIRQLIISSLWTILFIVTWRLNGQT